ncbi:MAG TPA: IS66 family transposase [Anaerolineaceae bacterium]|nr:IS66 family transposase [Anaerolineaceae bacterium]
MNAKDEIIADLKHQVEVLLQRIAQLEDEIARLKKDSSNSSKPPSSDIVKPKTTTKKVSRTKRKKGGQQGHRKFTRPAFTPEQIDEVIEYEFVAKDAQGLTPLDDWFVIQQIELPEQMYKVIEHKARKYLDPVSGKVWIAMPDEVRQGGLLGAGMTALVSYLKGPCHMSYTTIQEFFKQVITLDLSRGMLCKATGKTSDALHSSYHEIAECLPDETEVNVDETGHHDNGDLHWTWCFDTAGYSLFKIDKSRGSKVLKEMLGQTFRGIIGADYWGAYRKYARLFDVRVQYCMAHLIRDIRFLAEHSDRKLVKWGHQLLVWLKKLFETLHRRETLTEKGFQRSMKRIKAKFLKHMRRPPDHKLAKTLAQRFKGDAAEDYFRFLTEPIEPTNNGTERQIRPVVIDRKITQGTRGQTGMRWCERIWTTFATCKKQQRNVFDFIHQSIVAHWNDKKYPSLIR